MFQYDSTLTPSDKIIYLFYSSLFFAPSLHAFNFVSFDFSIYLILVYFSLFAYLFILPCSI